MKHLPDRPRCNTQLRLAVEADDPELFELFSACREDLLAAISNLDAAQRDSLLRIQFQAQRDQYHHQFPHACQSLVVHEDEIIGQIMIARGQKIRLVDLALLPTYRNLGIGSALLRDLLDEARASGKCVVLHVMQGNPAVRLYRRLGFVYCGEEGVYLRMEWIPAGNATLGNNAQR